MMNEKQTGGGGPGRGAGLSQGAGDAHGHGDSLGTQGEDHPAAEQPEQLQGGRAAQLSALSTAESLEAPVAWGSAGLGSTPPAERLQRRHSHAHPQPVPVPLKAVFGSGDPEKKDFFHRSISMDNEMQHSTSDEPMKLTYDKIKEITNGLDKEQIVGSGAFGTVYKGVYENGEEIAVKILRNMSGFDCKEFLKEFRNLRGLKHQNVVELVGFCNEMEEVVAEHKGKQVLATKIHTALCFQYVNNGSLQKHISDESTGLNWPKRYKIIKGICQGLKYLREGLETPVMHLDLKPDNILLDQEMVPKIADFGLSRLLGEENTRRTLSSVGTLGYLPPEYIELQVISEAFDIFSLGVIITKIVTGHEGYSNIADMTPRKFVKQIHDKWRKRLVKILKPRPLEVYCHQVKKCIEIALGCIKRNRQDRPTIQHIVSTLLETETMVQNLGADQCLRVCPEVSTFAHIEVCRSSSGSHTYHDHDDIRSSTKAKRLGRDHTVYTHLARGLLSPYLARNCITQCIGASSTDSFPRETIKNTLEPVDPLGMRPSYWSSKGHPDPCAQEYLLYRLQADLCLVDEVKVQPFKAYFHGGNPIYSAKCIRFQMGYPRSPLRPETLVCDENEGQLIDDRNYVWTYTSPEFPMLQENILQSFKLRRPVLCIGGVVKVELLGRVQKQSSDGLYYICMSHVQIVGKPLSRELGVAPRVKGVVLTYYPGLLYPVIADQCSKTQCLRVCPEVSIFAHVEVCRSSSGSRTDHDPDDVRSSTIAERLDREHTVYTHLALGLFSPYTARNCIIQCIGASSTDSFPRETIKNTVEPVDFMGMRPSYWSSRGHRDPSAHECLIYRLQSDLCLVDEVKVQPFKAYFHGGNPTFSAKCIRFQMGYPRSPLRPETLVCDENEGQLIDDSNYVWTYTSPEFPMLQENILQSFKLPRPVLCIGGVVKLELLGGVQKQQSDGLYYIRISHVQIVGKALSRELRVASRVKGVVLTYYPDLLYPAIADQCSKTQCLRVCPEVSIFAHVEVCSSKIQDDVRSSTKAERLERDNTVYTHLARDLFSPYTSSDCIIQCIGASSTDSFPRETIKNTLEPVHFMDMRPSYWSSRGHREPSAHECLIYRLQADLCLVDEVKAQPFKVHGGNPIYSSKCIRFQMGYPRSPLRRETLVCDEYEGQLIDDRNYVWTYTSPEFPMLQENILQSFKLPRPVLCIGGVVKVELVGGVEKQASDGLYYICMSHVQIMGKPLSRELGVAPGVEGVVLTYYHDLVYPVIDDMCSKSQCLRVCPEVSIFTHVEVCGSSSGSHADHAQDDVRSSTKVERLDTNHTVYTHLALGLLTPYTTRNCIMQCIGASSTDRFPQETIKNTLEPVNQVGMMPSHWSSKGHPDPCAQECLIYRLQTDMCLVDEVRVQPFKASFQGGNPIYSAKCIRFKMGYLRSPLRAETLVSDEHEGQLAYDRKYAWTYTSPEFPMLQENIIQSFKLPCPVLCIGGVVKVELLGGVQKQASDGLYYICISYVQIVGKPLSRELGVAPRGNGVVLTYYPDLGRIKSQGSTSRFLLSGTTRGTGRLNQGLLSKLLCASLRIGDEDEVSEEDYP